MKVIATAAGSIGKGKMLRRVRIGEVFEVPEGTKSKWFKPVATKEAAASKPAPNAPVGKGKPAGKSGKGADKEPQTFGDLARRDAATITAEGGNDLV